jgi:hypothetical protein
MNVNHSPEIVDGGVQRPLRGNDLMVVNLNEVGIDVVVW